MSHAGRLPALTYADARAQTYAEKVTPVRVRLQCSVEGCTGDLEFTGTSFTQLDTTCDHRCNACGQLQGVINAQYPRIEYRKAE